jgi:hypothetical protein
MSKLNNLSVVFEYGKTTLTEEMAANTVYIDGAVQGPSIDNERRSYSFDHHANCVRAFTLASCQQVAQALELGWDSRGLEVVVNDLDADTMVSVWLILHPERVREDRVRELVNRVGFVDAHGPAIPGRLPHPLHFALTPRYGQEQTEALFQSFLATLDNWFETGEEPSAREDRPAPAFGLTVDGELKDLGNVSGFQDVYKTCVVGVVLVPGPESTVGYTVGKVSDFVSYDIKGFLARCNEIEPGWGGGSTIGGAPRLEGGKRSALNRSQVEEILLAGVVKS